MKINYGIYKEYLGCTFITCLLHFSQKNIFESRQTTLLHKQAMYYHSSLATICFIAAKTTKELS